MKNWYNKSTICYEMFFTSEQITRETAFLKPKHQRKPLEQSMFRYIKIFKTTGVPYFIHNYLQCNNKGFLVNVYASLAKYGRGIPDFGTQIHLKKDEIDKWKITHHYEITAYDCLIDIDSPDHESMTHAKHATLQVMSFFDEYNIPYYLRFSGMGYHIVIPYEAFKQYGWHFNPDSDYENSIYYHYNLILDYLHNNISELVDTDLHDSRRITKVPYSLVFYDDITFVCWPFKTKKEFANHDYSDYRILNPYLSFKGFENCYHRNQTLFNQDFVLESTTTNFLKKAKVIKDGETKKNS